MNINRQDLVVKDLTPEQCKILAYALLMEQDCKIRNPNIRLEFLPATR